MEKFSAVVLLALSVLVSGCWDNEKEKRAAEFMSTMTKCDNCQMEKPLIGGTKAGE